MPRNTDINSILFPVELKPIFLGENAQPVRGYKAVTANPDTAGQSVFSVVSDSYFLITNQFALELAKKVHQRLFPESDAKNFEIFNIIAPATKSFCQIDIIDKNYTLNIWKQEVYVPFVRLHNSYNKSRTLKFDIGFCRKLCDNGVIFEAESVSISFSHTKKELNLDKLQNINVDRLKRLEQDFIKKTQKSLEIAIPEKYFLPLAAQILGKKFNLNEKDPQRRARIENNFAAFRYSIDHYSEKYIRKENFGETGYSFFNVITDFASRTENANAINGLQTKCGTWLRELGEQVKSPGFNWGKELEDYLYLLDVN
jgi:hypothetical protein